MITLRKLIKYIRDPEYRFCINDCRGFYNFLPDKIYLKYKFRIIMGYKLDLKNPETFNEKLQWLKLYDRKPIYTVMVDKVKAKEYVAEKIGSEYIIPTLGVWDRPEDIDYDTLPDQFVLKCNHNSGKGMYICKDKSSMDIEKVNRELREGLKENYYITQREWPYKNIERKILAEKYMKDSKTDELNDYKFFCSNGKLILFKIDFDRSIDHRANFYDKNGNLLNIGQVAFPPVPEKKDCLPEDLNKMIEIAETLSEGIPFLRVDLYYVDNKIYFGELTFYHMAGFDTFSNDGDRLIGKEITL